VLAKTDTTAPRNPRAVETEGLDRRVSFSLPASVNVRPLYLWGSGLPPAMWYVPYTGAVSTRHVVAVAVERIM